MEELEPGVLGDEDDAGCAEARGVSVAAVRALSDMAVIPAADSVRRAIELFRVRRNIATTLHFNTNVM